MNFKKNAIHIGGNLYIFENKIEFDRFEAVHQLIQKESMKINGMSKTACFKRMKVSSTGYYNWLNQREDREQKKVKQQIKLRNNSHETANKQLIHLNKILEMTKVAVEFYRKASPELKESIKMERLSCTCIRK